MRNVLSKKLKNKKGFTLAELLIVVAIIAILVAIMLPVFTNSRANAIQAKDAANIRSALSDAVVAAMSSNSYDASGKLQIEIETPAKDSTTTVTYNTTAHTITVDTANATDPDAVITVDEDVIITSHPSDWT